MTEATPSSDDGVPKLVFAREVAAPVAIVYRAWTEPEQLAHWWGPHGFSLTTISMAVEAGGVWEYVLHGPDGLDYPNRAVFEEVDPPRRLVLFNTGGHVRDQHLTCRMVVDFVQRGAGTLVKLQMVFQDAEQLDRAKARGAEQGGVEAFERLAAWLAYEIGPAPGR